MDFDAVWLHCALLRDSCFGLRLAWHAFGCHCIPCGECFVLPGYESTPIYTSVLVIMAARFKSDKSTVMQSPSHQIQSPNANLPSTMSLAWLQLRSKVPRDHSR